MALYIETKIRYDKMQENGIVKKVTEKFLVNALSFTEAEARIIEEQTPFISGEFSVSAVKKTNIAEIFSDQSNGDRWYNCKLNFITIDEKTATEKKKASHILVLAHNFDDALDNLKNGMKGTVANYEIAGITETDILDVYPAKSSSEK